MYVLVWLEVKEKEGWGCFEDYKHFWPNKDVEGLTF